MAPVWYRPEAIRYLSKYGFSKIELQINRQYANFDVRLWTPIVGLSRVPGGEVALIVRSVGTLQCSNWIQNVVLPLMLFEERLKRLKEFPEARESSA
ncbi:unnamed protein product [Prunus armeniaca]